MPKPFVLIALLLSIFATRFAHGDDAVKITDSKLSSINYGIESLEHWIAKLADKEDPRRQQLLRDHDRLRARFNRLPSSKDSQYLHIAKRLRETRQQIETGNDAPRAAKHDAVAKNSSNQTRSDKVNSTAQLPAHVRRQLASLDLRLRSLEQDEERYREGTLKQRQRVRRDSRTLQASFDRMPTSGHPDYIAFKKRLGSLMQRLKPAEALHMTAAEVTETLNHFRNKYYEILKLPRSRDMLRTGELSSQEVDAFVKKANAFTEQAKSDLPRLKQLLAATGEGEVLVAWVETKANEELQREMSVVKTMIHQSIERGIDAAKRCSELDIEKDAYTLNSDVAHKKHIELFARTSRTIEQAVRLEAAMEWPTTWKSRGKELERFVAAYNVKLAGTIHARKLPNDIGSREQIGRVV
ncbi:MAG: hypothetical protein AAFU85_30085, partial [Planctomycetota bacterium]